MKREKKKEKNQKSKKKKKKRIRKAKKKKERKGNMQKDSVLIHIRLCYLLFSLEFKQLQI